MPRDTITTSNINTAITNVARRAKASQDGAVRLDTQKGDIVAMTKEAYLNLLADALAWRAIDAHAPAPCMDAQGFISVFNETPGSTQA